MMYGDDVDSCEKMAADDEDGNVVDVAVYAGHVLSVNRQATTKQNNERQRQS